MQAIKISPTAVLKQVNKPVCFDVLTGQLVSIHKN